MNLKKIKDNEEQGVKTLYSILDSVVDADDYTEHDDPAMNRAVKLQKYVDDMNLLIHDGLTSPQDLIQSLDEMEEPELIKNLMNELAKKYDQPESLDEKLWDYIKHTDINPVDAAETICNSEYISDEVATILADDILSAYE